MNIGSRRRFGWIVSLALVLLIATPAVALSAGKKQGAQTVGDVEFLGEVVIPTGTMFDGTEIGGLSSITFDAGQRSITLCPTIRQPPTVVRRGTPRRH